MVACAVAKSVIWVVGYWISSEVREKWLAWGETAVAPAFVTLAFHRGNSICI